MFLNPPSLPELRMWAQVKCSHRKPSSASIGRLHDLLVSFEDHESGRRYRLVPFPLYRYLLYDIKGRKHDFSQLWPSSDPRSFVKNRIFM